MRKKIFVAILLFIFVLPVHSNAEANPITIFIDGEKLKTDQSPYVVNGRMLVPLRAIFEALGAKLNYDGAMKSISAVKGRQKVTLVVDSDFASINSKLVPLDVPAQIKNGRTFVPVRFVVEELGAKIDYRAAAREIYILSNHQSAFNTVLDPVTKLSVADVSEYGNGRDIEVSFSKLSHERNLIEYRAFVVRTNDVNSFDLTKAKSLPSTNYTVIPKRGSDIKTVLSSTTRDSSGVLIRDGVPYKIFILSVGNESSGISSTLSHPSSEIMLGANSEDTAVTNIQAKDVANYNDGRDLEVTFVPPSNENRVQEYRILVVPSSESHFFDLNRANKIYRSNYTVVTQSGATREKRLSSVAKDVNGKKIKNYIPYEVFILSVGGSANNNENVLSRSSATITLTYNTRLTPVTNVKAVDVNNFGDGKDIRVSFDRLASEWRVQEYRILIVKESQSDWFNLSLANQITLANYTAVPTTRNNISKVLHSQTRDVYGEFIQEGINYKVFILAVATNNNNDSNSLSKPSTTFRLN